MRLTFPRARARAGLPSDFIIRTVEDYDLAERLIKQKIIDARRANDDATAAGLSEVKAYFKQIANRKRFRQENRFCPVCGDVKDRRAKHCRICANRLRNYGNTLPSIPK